MKFSHSCFALLLLVLASCSLNHITPPPVNPNINLVNTVSIPNATTKNMEGIYVLDNGDGGLGSQFVCKVSKYKVSFFSDRDGIFFILDYGLNPTDSSIQFGGFWRYSENAKQDLINVSIDKDEGAGDFLKTGSPTNLHLKAVFRDQGGATQSMTLKFNRPFSQYAQSNPFIVLGHHGVQTTAGPPYSENSVGGVLHDEDYGTNGIEFDVRLTKDHVPICLHDNAINIRLTEKGPLSGEPSQYPFPLLENYIRLVDGEKIPSVEQVLKAFVDSTTMKYVWFDIKGDPGIFSYMEPIVRAAIASAAAQNRDVIIFTGLPSTDVIDEFKATRTYATLPMLCELNLQDVLDNHCMFWGPRYSRGLLLDEVAQAHADGVKVISWTLNDKNIIKNYLINGKFDGFISDYPAYVVYDFYTLF